MWHTGRKWQISPPATNDILERWNMNWDTFYILVWTRTKGEAQVPVSEALARKCLQALIQKHSLLAVLFHIWISNCFAFQLAQSNLSTFYIYSLTFNINCNILIITCWFKGNLMCLLPCEATAKHTLFIFPYSNSRLCDASNALQDY